ncbi:bacterial Ig-like domain-containing protein [Erysipelothrix rhusiopathiae]|uniref:bacterial Ig-like domain-containing protein n=1 Tax=Erysipelothrix rhusiopathiae TaxID=1648 RepID=UPI0020B16E6F|nr:bacterial Ig-like domain-containing protein [Erysipelothrix rhusiopathiae]MDE8082588.1 bacterial Ig-like domain-containing protein [Erysipelothrix rhusiopathiae]MDE8228226.1 bacterial Ig-like domain-containing protein [Erysipelothrix rhusiopathiae]
MVKEDLTRINVKDSTIHVSDTWNAKDKLMSAKGQDWNFIESSLDTIDAIASVDIQHAGEYTIMYSLKSMSRSDEKNTYKDTKVVTLI